MNDLKEAMNGLGWLDLVFLIPLFFLDIYLPTYNFISILLNVLINYFSIYSLSSLSFSIKNLIKAQK
ncbi:DUF6007 family protein [Staphylococcus pseudoxylosus]|nr:DUF6007 family protein [Staphylococcus pseudoxylosus]